MFQIGKTLVSSDIKEKEFVCNLTKCKGICCVEGDSGAPLNEDELDVLQSEYEKIKPFLRPEGIKAIEQQGTHVIDSDNDAVTPLVKGKECAYVVFDEKGTTKCGIEKAYENGATTYQKPISCHLYPIRIKEYESFTAVNYHQWEICSDACKLGKELSVKVYQFLKEPLIRKFGEDWYEKLVSVIEKKS